MEIIKSLFGAPVKKGRLESEAEMISCHEDDGFLVVGETAMEHTAVSAECRVNGPPLYQQVNIIA